MAEYNGAYLHNKREPILKVDLAANGMVEHVYEVINERLLPICLQDTDVTETAVNAWLRTRKIPSEDDRNSKRERIVETRRLFPEFERYRNMFSLSDQYWFQIKKSDSWDKLNYFTNRYSDVTGRMFFAPWEVRDGEDYHVETPDLTTNGVLVKHWKQDKDLTSYLLKSGSRRYRQEPLSEVLASVAMRKIGLVLAVTYELTSYGVTVCSMVRNFVTQNTEFVPAVQIVSKNEKPIKKEWNEYFVEKCSAYGIEDAEDYLSKLIAANRMIGNRDLHFGNFGFIRDAETGRITGFAPAFDFGTAFAPKRPGNPHKSFFENCEDAYFNKWRRKIDAEQLREIDGMKRLVRDYPNLKPGEREKMTRLVEEMAGCAERSAKREHAQDERQN